MFEKIGKASVPAMEMTSKYFGLAKDYFVDELIPTAKAAGEALGPGIAEGLKRQVKSFEELLITL